MMGDLKVLETDKQVLIKDSKEILEEAMKKDFESVLVLGVKDGQVHITSSRCNSMTQTMGMIELARLDFWQRW